MKRRFVVGIDDETLSEVWSFLGYIQQQGFGWWHWFNNFWLLTTYNDAITAVNIRDKLAEISNGKNVIVIEVNSIIWANFGPQGDEIKNDSKNNISTWLTDVWDKL